MNYNNINYKKKMMYFLLLYILYNNNNTNNHNGAFFKRRRISSSVAIATNVRVFTKRYYPNNKVMRQGCCYQMQQS